MCDQFLLTQENALKEVNLMKRIGTVIAVVLSFVAGAALSAQVRDWHDLDDVHKHVIEAIHEMDQARAANHYDMQGHGVRAEKALHEAERELGLAVDAAKASAR
jgi:hypothetical protein